MTLSSGRGAAVPSFTPSSSLPTLGPTEPGNRELGSTTSRLQFRPANDTHPSVACEACGHPGGLLPAFVVAGYPVVRCPHCRLLSTVVSESFDPATLYTRGYFPGEVSDGYFDYLGSEGLLGSEFEDRLAVVQAAQPQGRLLEIGCATGGFLERARRFFEVKGLDVSAFAAEKALGKGLDVECASLENSTTLQPPYDVVALFDAFEHLPRPADTLRRIREVLVRGGAVVLSTGDAGSLFARITGRRWRLMTPPQHLWFFDRNNIRLLFDRLGFDVIRLVHLWRRVPMSLMWYQVFRGKRRPLPDRLGRLMLPVNLFDNMTVVARRRA